MIPLALSRESLPELSKPTSHDARSRHDGRPANNTEGLRYEAVSKINVALCTTHKSSMESDVSDKRDGHPCRIKQVRPGEDRKLEED